MTLDNQSLSRLLETAVVAARLAGQHAIEKVDFVKVSIKNKDELVTQADIECQKIIIDRIKEAYPDHGFVAEEGDNGKLFKQSPRGSEPIWWVIDPIDGTNNFAQGMPFFAISIGVMYEGWPVVGVIFDPSTESMYTAVKDGETQLNGRRITSGENDMDVFTSVSFDSHFQNGVPKWVIELMHKTRYRILGAASLQFAYVAKGSFTGTVINNPKLWDIAGGSAICLGADAVITDFEGKNIFPFDVENYSGIALRTIVANKKVHPQLVELIKNSK